MTFKIDLTKINNIKQRKINNDLKISVPAILLVGIIMRYLTLPKGDLKIFIYVSLSLIPILILRTLFSIKHLKRTAESFEILLTDTGIEQIFKSKLINKINWGDMKYELKHNGFINVLNKSFPASNKKKIIIPPEIENREQLINELKKHTEYLLN